MTTWTVLVSAPFLQAELARFRPALEAAGCELVVPVVHERLNEPELMDLIPGIDGAICGDDRFTARVLERADRLRVISKWGTGTDSIDREACARRGITVCSTPDAFSEPVADSVLGYVLAFARRLPWMDQAMRGGEWRKLPGRSLHECTLGVIGVGNVGRAVIRRAAAFGMPILGNDPIRPPEEFLVQHGVTMVALHGLLAAADFVSVNCDLNPTSLHLLDDAAFAATKPGAVVVNTARGPIVDEAALVRALGSGRLGGAALDVFEVEPLPAGSPLRGFPNVMLAPHNANSSPGPWARVHENTIRNLLRELRRDA